ncbi:MAG: hypothetical protein MRK02_07495 [Candidatus Scalindua sp.]|nr:hypothetical protein [Candidatus Scalindua sp.]
MVIGMGCRSLTNRADERLRTFPHEISVGDIAHVASGEKISFSQLAESINGFRIVYVGEIHSNRDSHDMQIPVTVTSLF